MQVIHGGTDAFDALLYPRSSPQMQEFFQSQVSMFSHCLTDIGQAFMSQAKEVYDRINSSAAAQLARTALRAAKGMFHPNQIIPLETVDEIRLASPVMQRYIMACPDIRTLYHNNQCNGFSDTYVDNQPGVVGVDHYDYRRVMNGVVVHDEEGDGEIFYSQHIEDLVEGDRELTHGEQVDVLTTWDYARLFMQRDQDDVTDIFQGKL